jgi:RNA recognition motif-containing protein
MPRDKTTGKSKGFAFLMYEDQRSTILAVDNLNGAKVLDKTLRVDHVKNYQQPRKRGEDGEWIEAEDQSLNARPEMIKGVSLSMRTVLPVLTPNCEQTMTQHPSRQRRQHPPLILRIRCAITSLPNAAKKRRLEHPNQRNQGNQKASTKMKHQKNDVRGKQERGKRR